ncbi:MAG TPA: hypothetical protein VN641_09715 [Urbifossiella sp.]|jgi:hypothetical protein|nr:hypothetical protein [Urbifossiella sp.]
MTAVVLQKEGSVICRKLMANLFLEGATRGASWTSGQRIGDLAHGKLAEWVDCLAA